MSNAKRFLSVILAIIMVCSTLVIGANAAYTAYKDEAILDSQYNALDQAVLTTDQYASAAMDEIDRMLDEEQLSFTREDIYVGDIDLTSVDKALDGAYALVNGTLFNTLKGMLGNLKDINVSALRYEKDGGARRTTAGKTDLDVFFVVFQFLYDNKNLLTSFLTDPNFSLGSIVEGLVDVSEFKDVSKLLKGLLYEATYEDENGDSLDAPDNVGSITFDTMVQDLIDRLIANEITMDDQNIGQCFVGLTDISTGTMYDFIDRALKAAYNGIGVPVLNTIAKEAIGGLCGAEYITEVDPDTFAKTVTYDEANSELNQYAQLLNVEYEVPTYEFTSAPLVDQLNNVIKTIGDALVNPDVFVWQAGDNSMLKTNIVNLGKAALINTGDDFFASYIEVADAETVEAMTDQEIAAYALRAIINASVDEMYIPQEATTIREFGFYTLKQLLATAMPTECYDDMEPTTETLIVMGINYAIYSVNAELDMDLEYVYDMDGVNEQLKKAAQYGIDNYGGLFSGITFTADDDGWSTIEKILFRILDRSWLPAASNGSFQTFLIDNLIENILDLDFEALVGLLNDCPANSELLLTPKKVVINRVASILNTILPGAINGNATTIEQIGSNAALGATLGAVIDDLYNNRQALAKSILPTLCSILDLTNPQEFEFPKITFDRMIKPTSGIVDYDITIRNESTGINTGYTDQNGDFHQDSLYTYQITGVETSVAGVNATALNTEIAGGQKGVINLNGSCSSDTPIRISISYNVLTEDGSPLTETPITEDIYAYLANTASVEEATFKTTAPSGKTFFVSNGPANIFAKSMGDLTDYQLTIENTSRTDTVDAVPHSNVLSMTENKNPSTGAYTKAKPVDENGVAWFKVNDEPITIAQQVVDDKGRTYNGVGRVDLFDTTEEYDALTREEKDAVWDSMIAHMTLINGTTHAVNQYPKLTIELGATAAGSTSKVTNANFFIYKDYGIASIIDSELGKHRQASAYTDPAAWTAYQNAMIAAVDAAYSPFVVNTFARPGNKFSKYEPAYNALVAAIEGLEECTASAGVESTLAIIDKYNPSNEEGVEYYEDGYQYFAVADYVAYTYYNYRDEYKSAQKMIDRANALDPETGEHLYVINELDKTYTDHRLDLYGSRLIPVEPNNQHLANEVAYPTRSNINDVEWSAESWDNYQTALAFANSVLEETDAKQSKINKAYEELLEAEKRLVIGSDEPTDAYFELVEPTGEADLEAYETAEGVILTGISGGDEFDPEAYFNCVGCTAEAELTSADCFGTGAVVTITEDATGKVLATYYIAVFGDLNGDATTDINDLSIENLFGTSKKTYTECEGVAGDMNLDGGIDINDVSAIKLAATSKVLVDCVNRTTYQP